MGISGSLAEVTGWDEKLRQSGLPIYIYGMGDGCEKLLKAFEQKGLKASGIFVSDDFKRDKSFHGFKLMSMSELENSGGEFAAACAFGTNLPEIMERIDSLNRRHLLVFPETAVIGDVFFEKTALLERSEDIEKVYSLLSDDKSKRCFTDVLSFRISGDIAYLSEWSEPDGIFELLSLGEDEIYADLGAYTGDTVEQFLKYTGGRYESIYAVEPSRRNFSKCVKRCEGLDNTVLINAAASDRDGILYFSSGAGRQQSVSGSGIPVAARSLDSILDGKRCTYIKYDVEGEDAPAIRGSAETIRKYMPKLRTGIYHRPYDILDLPLLVNSIAPQYRLYMRRARYYPAWDTELIALP